MTHKVPSLDVHNRLSKNFIYFKNTGVFHLYRCVTLNFIFFTILTTLLFLYILYIITPSKTIERNLFIGDSLLNFEAETQKIVNYDFFFEHDSSRQIVMSMVKFCKKEYFHSHFFFFTPILLPIVSDPHPSLLSLNPQ